MMTNNPLKTALWEADRHLDTLESALQDRGRSCRRT